MKRNRSSRNGSTRSYKGGRDGLDEPAKRTIGNDGRRKGTKRKGPFFLYHATDPKNVDTILREGLKAVSPGEGKRGREEFEEAIQRAEEMTDAHGDSVFFYNDHNKVDTTRPIVIIDVRKLGEGTVQWAEQGPWESLVGQLMEAAPEEMTEEEWDDVAQQLAEEYVSGIDEYPSGEDTEEDEMPDENPDKQVWVSGDVPPEAIVAIILRDGTIIEHGKERT